MELTGRWKTRFAWGVIAVAGLIYLASLLPVVAAMEEEVIVVSDQLPSSVSDPFSVIMDGTGEPQADAAAGEIETSSKENDIGLDSLFVDAVPPAVPQDEIAVPVEPAAERETTGAPGDGELTPLEDAAPVESEGATRTDSGYPTPTGQEGTTIGSGRTEPADSEETEAADPDQTGELEPAEEPLEPVEQTPEELLAGFIATRLGLVTAETAFPSHDVKETGEFVFQTPSIAGTKFAATKDRPIPTGFSALISCGDGTMDGFELYRNMNHDPLYGDCYITMSSDGTVLFNNLAMEVTELSASPLIGARIFPILEFWTTNPGEDLPFGEEESPLDVDLPFYGGDFKVTVIKMTADYIQIPNFSLRVGEGTIQFGN